MPEKGTRERGAEAEGGVVEQRLALLLRLVLGGNMPAVRDVGNAWFAPDDLGSVAEEFAHLDPFRGLAGKAAGKDRFRASRLVARALIDWLPDDPDALPGGLGLRDCELALVTRLARNTADAIDEPLDVLEVEPLEGWRGQCWAPAAETARVWRRRSAERLAAFIVDATQSDFVAETNGADPSGLVGRDRELALVRDTVAATQETGRGAMLLFAGEAGVGKTAVAEAAARHAADRGFETMTVICEAFHAGLSLFPVREVLRQLLGEQAPAAFLATYHGEDSAAAAAARLAESSSVDAATRSDALRATFTNVVLTRASAGSSPLLIVFEDLEHVDSGTIDALLCLLGRLSEAAAVVVGAYRTEWVASHGEGHAIAPLLRRAARSPHVTLVDVLPLAVDHLPSLIERQLGPGVDVPASFVDRLYAATDGNPLFVRELLRSLTTDASESAVLTRTAGGWKVGEMSNDHRLPQSLEEAIEFRLNALSEDDRADLELASVIGRRFAFEIVAALSQAHEDLLLRRFQRLIGIGIVRECPDCEHHFEFSHGTVRDVLYSSILRLRRQRLHSLVADALVALQQGRVAVVEDWDALIGEHLHRAGRPAEALPYLRRAGDASADLFSFAAAATQYERAIEAAEAAQLTELDRVTLTFDYAVALKYANRLEEAHGLLGQLSVAAPPALRCAALNHLGDVLVSAGQVEEALAIYIECVGLAEDLDDIDVLVDTCGDLAEVYGREVGRQADPQARELCLAQYEHWLERELRLAPLSRDATALPRALRNDAMHSARVRDFARALATFEEALAATHERPGFYESHVRIPYAKTLRLVGERARALTEVDRVLGWSIATGVRRSEGIARQYRGLILFDLADHRGDADEARAALRELERALLIHDEARFTQGAIETLVDIGTCHAFAGDWGAAEDLWQRAFNATSDPVGRAIAELTARGEFDRAERLSLGAAVAP